MLGFWIPWETYGSKKSGPQLCSQTPSPCQRTSRSDFDRYCVFYYIYVSDAIFQHCWILEVKQLIIVNAVQHVFNKPFYGNGDPAMEAFINRLPGETVDVDKLMTKIWNDNLDTFFHKTFSW